MTAQVELLTGGAASDEALVESLTRLINAAYAVGEQDLWVDATTRTATDDIAEAIRGGGMLAATRDGRVVGCARVRPLGERGAELGLVSAAPEEWGSGVGRALVRRAEELMRSRGVTTAQLQLLVPRDRVHPEKERLRRWYVRLGYSVVRTASFEEVAGHPASGLATPCDFLILRKSLAR